MLRKTILFHKPTEFPRGPRYLCPSVVDNPRPALTLGLRRTLDFFPNWSAGPKANA